MALTKEQSIAKYGTEAYTAWGETEAEADAKAKGLSGGGGSVQQQYDDLTQGIFDSILGRFNQVKPYEQVNPFSFDEKLATEAATAEYSPYYDQMLSDYTSTVERTKSRSQEDYNKTIEQLNAGKEYYSGTERRLLDRALDTTDKGYASNGLFFSGARQKDIAQLNTEYQAETGEYNRQYEYNVGQAGTALQRTKEDVGTAASQYSRDVGQAKKTAIAQGVLQRQSEAVQQYEAGRQQYYDAAQYGATGSRA